ncbi:MAG: type VI secretion system tip protein TssI/VgrG [Myxococcota bacterium]
MVEASFQLPTLVPFTLALEGLALPLRVLKLQGRESMSRTYRLRVLVHALPHMDTSPSALLGRRFWLLVPGLAPRLLEGVVSSCARSGAKKHGGVHLTLISRLGLSRLRRRSRIFQHVDVPTILRQLLAEVGMACEFKTRQTFAPLEYVTQYEESDYTFLLRTAARAGLFFYLQSPPVPPASVLGGPVEQAIDEAMRTKVVFGDHVEAYRGLYSVAEELLPEPVPRPIAFTGESGAGMSSGMTHFVRRRGLSSTAVLIRDYDPSRPNIELSAHASTDADGVGPEADGLAEHYEHNPSAIVSEWGSRQNTMALRALQERRRRADTARGGSTVSDLRPGALCSLTGHPVAELDADYLITSVTHDYDNARTARPYRNRLEAVPADVVFRPRRPARRNVTSTLTATVVAPAGEDVYTDEQGRIKVHFHWDREHPALDPHSSCWIRVMQGLSGANWGTQYIPRAGMEVVVAFDGGDPDRPVILGSLYNGTHPPPFVLPREKHRSGYRSRTLNGSGTSEISVSDAKGNEELSIHAHRRLDVRSGQDRCVRVAGSDDVEVKGDQRTYFASDAKKVVGRNAHQEVLGDAQELVRGTRETKIRGDEALTVGGMRQTTTDHDERHHVHGTWQRESKHLVERVGSSLTSVVAAQDGNGLSQHHVEGVTRHFASKSLELESPLEIVLRCGESTIHMRPDGIDIMAPRVTLDGGSAVEELSGGGAVISASGASLALGAKGGHLTDAGGGGVHVKSEVRVDGSQILLNSPVEATDAAPPERLPPTTVVVRDQDGNPISGARFDVVQAGRVVRGGVSDREGKATVYLEEDGEIRFQDLPEEKR